MRFGSPLAAGFGSPDNHLLYALREPSADGTRVNLTFRPRAGYGNAGFSIFANSRFVENVYAYEGRDCVSSIATKWGWTRISIFVMRLGHFLDPFYQDEKVARTYENADSRRATIAFRFVPAIIEPLLDDGGYTSSWALTGLDKRLNTMPVPLFPNRGKLLLDLAVSGGTVTVTLRSNSLAVCSGSAAILGAPFPVALAEQNGSGLSGTVTVSNLVANVSGALLEIRWPKEMKVKRNTFDPPTTIVASVPFDGNNSVRWTEGADLAPGTYYYRLQPLSDTDDLGTESPSQAVIIPGPPESPANLAYLSGNAAATVLQFTPSATPGASYRAYVANVGEVINLNDIDATAPPAATTIALPPITGFPGIARVILRAVLAGAEDKNADSLGLEYDAAGNFVLLRPNHPLIDLFRLAVTAGRTIAAPVDYSATGEKGVATEIRIFKRAPAGSYNYAAPEDTKPLAATVGSLKRANTTFTLPSNGYWYIQALAATAAGTLSPVAGAQEILVYVSDQDMPAASEIIAAASRG